MHSAFASGLETSKVARARIRFEVTGAGLGSRVAAEARDYVNSLPVVFTPGIAVRRDLVSDVGGILFNDPVPYAVDAVFDVKNQAGARFRRVCPRCVGPSFGHSTEA